MPNGQNSLSEYDTTERVEQTERGYRLIIESKRGNDVRDQDTVEGQARTETLQQLEDEKPELIETVTSTMNELRENQPDSEEEE